MTARTPPPAGDVDDDRDAGARQRAQLVVVFLAGVLAGVLISRDRSEPRYASEFSLRMVERRLDHIEALEHARQVVDK